MSVNKSVSPYFDDFDETKGYHEILFKPRRAVQTRELNQIQSIFHNQVQHLGNHIFKEGSLVIPGETSYDLAYNYVKVVVNDYENVKNLLSANNNTLTGGTSGVEADIIQFVEPGSDPATFYVQYTVGGTSDSDVKFTDNENLVIRDSLGSVIGTAIVEVNGTGLGSKFTVNSGVYYIGGRFVLSDTQTVILSKYSSTPSTVVGFEVSEDVVTISEDDSLYDNAQGTPNFTAPGADRLFINLTATAYDYATVDADSSPSFVELFVIVDGQVEYIMDRSTYAVLGDTLAQRTYEESGDYTINPFDLSFSTHDSDPNKFDATIAEGLAYVRGFRVENKLSNTIEIDRALDTDIVNNSSISATLGNYIEVSDPNIVPDIASFQSVNLYNAVMSTPGVTPSGSIIGTANIRLITKVGAVYRVYLFNIRNSVGKRATGFLKNVLSIHSSVGEPFGANIDVTPTVLYGTTENSLVYPLSVPNVKTLLDGGVSDTSFTAIKQYTSNADASGDVTITAATNEVFVAQNNTNSICSYTDADEMIDISGIYTLGGAPTGQTITISLGIGNASRPVRLSLITVKEVATQKTKILTNETVVGSLTNGVLSLGKADLYNVVSIIDNNGKAVKRQFTWNRNKTKSYYDISYVETKDVIAEPITVNFNYFAHSTGDFFSVDSYTGINYEDIPTESGVSLANSIDFRPRINDAGTSFSGAGSSITNIPVPFSVIRADIEHYLNRIDKIWVNADGEFGVQKGISALNPEEPVSPENAMVLYTCGVPAYTATPKVIISKMIENKRYTMRDIGKLENRIKNIEYYVSLNNLEQSAQSQQITDSVTGLNRFKNGFMTDAFVDHSVGDWAWEGYKVSTDSENGALRPEFSMNAVDLEYSASDSSNVVVNDGVATLAFNELLWLGQPHRSTTMNINPYAVFRWEGIARLTPSNDAWIDTVYVDPDVRYEILNNGKLTQAWNSSSLNWVGSSTGSSSTSNISSVDDMRTWWGTAGRTTTVTQITTTNRTDTTVRQVADRIIKTDIIPFMRSITVKIVGEGNRPFSRLHFFFDTVNVNAHVKPEGGSYNQRVVTDALGDFVAYFKIPNTSALSFRTGTKLLEISDSADNTREESTTYSNVEFTSSGMRNTRRRSIVATRANATTTSSRVLSRRTVWLGGGGGGNDPLAQSFRVETPGGVFLTSINVYFESKDSKVPVRMELREMENGQPTENILPGSKVSIHPSNITTSSNGSVATNFVFDYPIHVESDTEYCFVLLSNSIQYNVWIATLGEISMHNNRPIAKQPHLGVMFKSQNASTWTEDQNSDVMFKIYKADFVSSGQLGMINSDLPNVVLYDNPITTTNASNTVRIYRKGHNYVVGTEVVIADAVGDNGISSGALNGTHTVSAVVDPEWFEIVVADTASATGFIGGDITISDTIMASNLTLNSTDVVLNNTSIEYGITGVKGQSYDGTEVAYSSINKTYAVENKEVTEITEPMLITNRSDEIANNAGNNTMTVYANMNTSNSNISPIIDLHGINVITPFVSIDNNADQVDGENNHANYRSNISALSQAANSLRMYIDIDKPTTGTVIISARYGNSDEEVLDSDWVQMTDVKVQSSGDTGEFLENEYELEDLTDFTHYQVLIQLKSSSCVNFPIAKRMRVIALGT